jgi:c-di-AMP phosphodiesterase-like protein
MNKGSNDFTIITPQVALEKANDESLVVVVDVHRLSMTTAPKLISKAKKVIIIDHHRRAEEAIDDPVFSYIDPIASSATEMVVELIRYSQKKIKIKQRVATYMFAGILLDTNGFKTHTSTSTFEATMALKEHGADNEMAEDYLKDEYEEFALKNKILSNTITPYFGIVIACAPNSDPIERTILAKVGQEAMGVKGIKAIFVIGNINGNITGVSARSDGSINVQLIMEKLGGGGHFAAAAAQIKNATIEVVKTELLRLLDLYIREISVE